MFWGFSGRDSKDLELQIQTRANLGPFKYKQARACPITLYIVFMFNVSK